MKLQRISPLRVTVDRTVTAHSEPPFSGQRWTNPSPRIRYRASPFTSLPGCVNSIEQNLHAPVERFIAAGVSLVGRYKKIHQRETEASFLIRFIQRDKKSAPIDRSHALVVIADGQKDLLTGKLIDRPQQTQIGHLLAISHVSKLRKNAPIRNRRKSAA